MRCLPMLRMLLVTLAVLLCAGAAAAETPPDVVHMKNGGMLRGTISEKIPGERVVITLPNGEERTVPMKDVKCARYGSAHMRSSSSRA